MRCSLVLVALLASGCFSAFQMHEDQLRARASFDMRCPSKQLAVTEIDGQSAGIDGCGQRAVYVYNYASGTWILNSPGQGPNQAGFEAPPPPPASPPPPPPPPAR